jgi:SAM-dependent methyltransferase
MLTDPKLAGRIPRLLRTVQSAAINFGAKPPHGAAPSIYLHRPYYHDFSALGVRTNFDDTESFGERVTNLIRRLIGKGRINSGSHHHQHERDKRLVPMLEAACTLYEEKTNQPPESFLDVMGADGYYAFYALKKLRFSRAHCTDLNRAHIRNAEVLREFLKTSALTLAVENVYDLDETKYDVGLCSGGLYHLDNPEGLLKLLRDRLRVLVVLSTVSLRSDSSSYLIIPAPGWRHGSAFSREWLALAVQRAGWRIAARDGFAYEDALFDGQPEGVELLLCY